MLKKMNTNNVKNRGSSWREKEKVIGSGTEERERGVGTSQTQHLDTCEQSSLTKYNAGKQSFEAAILKG